MSRWIIVFVYLVTYFTTVELKKYSGKPEEEESQVAFLFIFAGLAVGGILRAITKVLNFPIPFRVLIIFVGIIVGIFSKYITHMEEYMEKVQKKPRLILMAFIPLIVFKTAFCIDAHTFMRSWGQIFFLAIPGLLISACFTGILMMMIIEQNDWSYAMGILFGALCSSIYPVEIVAMLKEVGQAKHLAILLEGEGMVGDNTVMILFQILLGVIDEDITTWYHVFMVFLRFACGGIVLGFICGKIMTWIMAAMYNDVVNMLISTIVSAYLTYYIGVEILSVSGIIAVVVLGIIASMEKTSLSVDVEMFLLYFWDMLAYVANTIVFLLAGLIIAERFSTYTSIQDYTLVLVTYVVAGVARLIAYIVMAPIVSRIGYGLTFKKMTIAVWSGVRGPVPFCLALSISRHVGLPSLGREFLLHVAGLITLTLLINATTMPVLLRLLGLSELSMARKVNMNNCMRHLQNRRDRTIAMLKMDRFLADANWPLVNTATILKHPYKINLSADSDEEEENYLGYRITTCPDCLKEIPNQPTTKEMIEMTREARLRILKAKKISYARQYENGMLSKDGIRVLTQAVETAMDTEDALIELEGLHKCFVRQGFTQYTRRKLLSVFFKKSENTVKPPRKYWRRICYHIIMHPAFDFFIYLCIALNVIPIGLEIGLMPKSGTKLSTGIKIANSAFFLIYLLEFIFKIYGYSWIYVCQHGFRTYFRSYWNMFDFTILCVAFVDLIMDYLDLFTKDFKVSNRASRVTLATKLIRVIRLIRLIRLCKAWYPKLIKYCDSRIDKHLAFAYDVGKGFVTGEEEVSDMLIQMIDNKVIREDCRLRMETDRLSVTKELGMVQKDRPWIAITVKTRQAIRATLNGMGEAILELKVSGWVDDVEYAVLMESLEEKLKYVRTKVKSVQPSPPKVMFKEVPWMADDEQISDFLYDNVVTKVFDQGDVVCVDGEMADGVYIIVTGLFKLSYTPKKEVLDSLAEFGTLPIIDYIASTRFDEKVEDYIVSGNCVGELSSLTGRPYNCTISADTASQAYILTHEVIKQAIQRSPDPVNGLESKMWKSLAIRLATSILMDTPAYQSSTQEKIRFQLERAFVPNLTNYKVFGVNDMMEDILLIEGVAFDYNTRDCYTAPCYIPRTVQKIVLPKSSHMDFNTVVETKLLIIPAKDVDEFDIMEREEEISEMVSTASVKCLQHYVQKRSSRLRRRRKRQTTFSMGGRRVKYGESRTSATQSVYYSRSRITNTSSLETELQDISMNDHVSMGDTSAAADSYVINEKENRASMQDRKMGKGGGIERRISARRASSIAPKRLLTNREDERTVDHRFSRQPPTPIADEQEDTKYKLEEENENRGKRRKEEETKSKLEGENEEKRPDQNFSNEQKEDDLPNSERKQSDGSQISERKWLVSSRKSPRLSVDPNIADNISPNKSQKKSEELDDVQKRHDSDDRKKQSNSLPEDQRSSADGRKLSKQDNLKSDRRENLALDEDLQNKRHSSSLKKLADNNSLTERQTSDDIEQIEVEQRSEIFPGMLDEKAYRRKSQDNTKTSKNYTRKAQVEEYDQRKSSNRDSLSQSESENAEKDNVKGRGSDESETTQTVETETSTRRKSMLKYPNKLENAEKNDDLQQRRKSDNSEVKGSQTVSPEAEISPRRKSLFGDNKFDNANYKNERRQSDTTHSSKKSDNQSDSQVSGDLIPEAAKFAIESSLTQIRKKSVSKTKDRKQSIISEDQQESGSLGIPGAAHTAVSTDLNDRKTSKEREKRMRRESSDLRQRSGSTDNTEELIHEREERKKSIESSRDYKEVNSKKNNKDDDEENDSSH